MRFRSALVCSLLSLAAPASADDKPRTPAADSGVPKLRIVKKSLASLNVDPALGLEVNAGTISRAALRAELARGIPQFLRQIRTEPAFARGRFVGWRVLELFPKRSDIHVLVLRPGDTVVRVNGKSVEHPEDFKSIWDALADARELVLDIERSTQRSKLRYTIVD
jgi:type II secretory pathway component PulC